MLVSPSPRRPMAPPLLVELEAEHEPQGRNRRPPKRRQVYPLQRRCMLPKTLTHLKSSVLCDVSINETTVAKVFDVMSLSSLSLIQVENGKAQAANFPFCTIEPNVGIVAVPDPRLNVLSELSKSQRAVPASIEFVDIAGLVKGASQGEVMPSFIYSNAITRFEQLTSTCRLGVNIREPVAHKNQ